MQSEVLVQSRTLPETDAVFRPRGVPNCASRFLRLEAEMALSVIVIAVAAAVGCAVVIAAILAVVWVVAQERRSK
jgi:hypothetical protein